MKMGRRLGERIGESASRRVGVCKASSTSSRPPDYCSRVEKQSYFRRRRYADTPIRPPADTPPQPTAHFDRNNVPAISGTGH
jgi:hypothetical protein